jgi:hypothetical protein
MNIAEHIDTSAYRNEEKIFYVYDVLLFMSWVSCSVFVLAVLRASVGLPEYIRPLYESSPFIFLFIVVVLVVTCLGLLPLLIHVALSKKFRDEPRLKYLHKLAKKYGLKSYGDMVDTKERFYGPSRYFLGPEEYPLVWHQEITQPYAADYPEYILAGGNFKGRKVQIGVYEIQGFIPHLEVIFEHRNHKIKHLVHVHDQTSSYKPSTKSKSTHELQAILADLQKSGAKRPVLFLGPRHLRLVMRYTSFYDLEKTLQAGYLLVKAIERHDI